MPDLFLERHMPHLPKAMFDLVSDLESYPLHPNCKAMDVKPQADGSRRRMTISFGPIPVLHVKGDGRPAGAHRDRGDGGPFAYLDSKWTFTPEARAPASLRHRLQISTLIAAVAEPAQPLAG